jgi:hypothetical protein
VAQGFGARGVRVEKAEELAATVRQAFAAGQPTVIHVPCALLGPSGQDQSFCCCLVGNPRSHPTKNLEAIKAALVEYGQVETILVNRRRQPWEVIHGNGRLQDALELGWTHVAAHIIDVDEATAKAMAVVLNRTGELAEWDKEELDKLQRRADKRNAPGRRRPAAAG